MPGCTFPGGTKPVIKVGLVAPFEGELRHLGYQRLYGVKLALKQANLDGGVAGYKIELVALNDYADADNAILQAQELVLDSDVRAVIGQWEPALHNASLSVYESGQLAVTRPAEIQDFSALPPQFEAEFEAVWQVPSSQDAQQAYLATRQLLNAVRQATAQFGSPDRSNVLQSLSDLYY